MRNYLVLFVGRTNAGRSLMAEALVSRWGAPSFTAVSAGLEPAPEIDPGAARAMRDELYATEQRPSRLLDVLTRVGKVDLVITLDPFEGPLDVPGNPPTVEWHVDDPRLHEGGEKDRLRAWRGVLRDLEARVKLLASLRPQGLDDFLLSQQAPEARSKVNRPASTRA